MSDVFIAVPNLGSVVPGLVERLLGWRQSFSGDLNIALPRGLRPIDHARNTIVRKFLSGPGVGYDKLFMIDSDVCPPEDALSLMDKEDRKIISGVTPVLKPDPNDGRLKRVEMALRHGVAPDGDEGLVPVEGEGVEAVDAVGASCLMIDREVLLSMGAPWFKTPYDSYGTRMGGEDFYFCRKASQDWDIHAHFGVICSHKVEVDI